MLQDFFKHLNDLYTKQVELQAIWLNKPITTSEGRTARIAADMLVRIENNLLVDVTDQLPATHKILMCMGTCYNQFELTVIDLLTNEPSQLKI